MRSRKSIYSATTPFTLLLIPGTPSTTSGTTATFTGIKNVRVYLAIAISTHINIVCERVTKIAKDI